MVNEKIRQFEKWAVAVLAAQIVFSILSFVPLLYIGSIFSGVETSTATCPDGQKIDMSYEVIHECQVERLRLLLPDWVLPLLRGIFGTITICFITGFGLEIAAITQRTRLMRHRFVTQLIAFLAIPTVYYLLFTPLDMLFRLLRYGINGY